VNVCNNSISNYWREKDACIGVEQIRKEKKNESNREYNETKLKAGGLNIGINNIVEMQKSKRYGNKNKGMTGVSMIFGKVII